MIHRRLAVSAAAFGLASAANASNFDNWPVKTKLGSIEFSLTANYQYDWLQSRHDRDLIDDSHTVRRREFGFRAAEKGHWDAIVYLDFQSRKWLDVFWRAETTWLFGEDYGRVRFGYSKLPVGFEGITSSRNDSFMELALPTQAFFQGRRTGVDWELERRQYLIDAGYYFKQDLQGDNDGTTALARIAWTPRKAVGDVLHLGISGSVEHPQSTVDGKGKHNPASIRFRARPEVGLTATHLVDSTALKHVDSSRRVGLEALWIRGPLSLQGEYLHAYSERDGHYTGYASHGYYAFGSYVLTGESRPYTAGNVGNIKPAHPWGAVELLVRYSALNLDDRGVFGGHEHDLTYGANWYLTRHFKFQANYVQAHAVRGQTRLDPDMFELRAQIYF